MTFPSSLYNPYWRSRFLRTCLCLVFFLFLLASTTIHTIANFVPNYPLSTRTYILEVKASVDDISVHISGLQTITFHSINAQAMQGDMSWNLTWDGGQTWLSTNITYIYDVNRTYDRGGFPTYTAWWISPNVQIGDHISIDGDAPATDYLTRSGEFLVTDLVSLRLGTNGYTCWLLVFETSIGQRETFYYEQWTGILVAAYSTGISSEDQPDLIQVELQEASPPLPQEDLFTHLWLTYGSLFVSIAVASIAAMCAHNVLQRVRKRRTDRWLDLGSEHNA